MFIDCYLLSNIARKIDHIYYTDYDYMFGEFFYFDLSICSLSNVRFNTFPYKVRIGSNDVFYITKQGLRAIKFQIVEEVSTLDWIDAAPLKDRTKSHLKSICNGTAPAVKVLDSYNSIVGIPISLLTKTQIFKLHAILSQKKYELPILTPSNGHRGYLRAYEFYSRDYVFALNYNSALKSYDTEAILGSKRFEYIESEDCEALMSDMLIFSKLLLTRKLTQKQFEDCCILLPFLTTNDKRKFVNFALRANYEIPHDCRHLFFPEIIFKHPNWVTELKAKHLSNTYEKARLLLLGYKIKDYNSTTSYYQPLIENARQIFKNDNYQYIELND